jgi:hypothetical protein
MKLYRVTLRGMTYSIAGGAAYGCPYVVAESTDEAIKIVLNYVNTKDLGFSREREVDRVELLAEQGDYPRCEIQLFIQEAHDEPKP